MRIPVWALGGSLVVCLVALLLMGCASQGPLGPQSIADYERQLSTGDQSEKLKAAEELVDLYSSISGALPALVTFALDTGDENASLAAYVAAQWIGLDSPEDPGQICDIIDSALETGTDRQKILALLMLGDLGHHAEPTIPHLLRILRGNIALQPVVAGTLGKIGISRGVAPELLKIYRRAELNPPLRGEAGLALARLGERKALPELVRDARSPDDMVRYFAVRALGMFCPLPPEGTRALAAVALDDSNDGIRTEAIKSLGNTYDTSSDTARAMARGLSSDNPRIRLAAARAVSQLHLASETLIRKLAKMANSKDYWERHQAMRSMVATGLEGIPTLEKLLISGNHNERQVAARALAGVSSEGVQLLIQTIKSGEPQAQLAAVRAMEFAPAYPELVSIGISYAIERRVWAYHAFLAAQNLRLSTDKVKSAAIRALQDQQEDQPVRIEAATLIGIIGRDCERCKEALTAAARDEDEQVSREAASILKAQERNRKEK